MAEITSNEILSQFSQAGAVKDSDMILFGRTGTTGADGCKILASLFRQYLTKNIVPYIGEDMTWYCEGKQILDPNGNPIFASGNPIKFMEEADYQAMIASGTYQTNTFYFRPEEEEE